MAVKFEELVDSMVNVGFGAAAVAVGAASTVAEKGREVLDDLAAKGKEARTDSSAPDFARSMSDIFERAGGTFSDVTERLSAQGETVAERILDELILARGRQLSAVERDAFAQHVRDLLDAIQDDAVSVKVESVETAGEDASSTAGTDGGAASDGPAAE